MNDLMRQEHWLCSSFVLRQKQHSDMASFIFWTAVSSICSGKLIWPKKRKEKKKSGLRIRAAVVTLSFAEWAITGNDLESENSSEFLGDFKVFGYKQQVELPLSLFWKISTSYTRNLIVTVS